MKRSQLLISGAGDLGMRVVRRLVQAGFWKLDTKDILCETLTDSKHENFSKFLFQSKLASDPNAESDALLMCFPPGPDYLEEVQRALGQWNQKRPAILISSTSVYTEDAGSQIDELAPVNYNSTQVKSENAALSKGAHVLRVAGLYTKTSGPQVHWQKIKELNVSPSAYINLIHRHDAADAIARLLTSKLKADVWNLSDGYALRRFDIDQLWSKYLKVAAVKFLDMEDPGLGKKLLSDKLFHALDWQPRWRSFPDFVYSLEKPRNVLGSPLKCCCTMPMTGFMRDGYCRTNEQDQGTHIICCEMTEAFLKFSKERGNDLSTPRPEMHFVGLKPGDKWCLCATRWLEALEAGVAPRIYVECTHESMIEWVEPEILRAYSLDLA